MKTWHIFALALMLSGCATSPDQAADTEDQALEAGDRVCVSVRSINSFDAIDDSHVYIKANVNDHYLFTMFGSCLIVYRDMGKRLESCRIDNVERVASKEDAEGLVKDRKEAKRREQAEKE
jgi:hypothetical protein